MLASARSSGASGETPLPIMQVAVLMGVRLAEPSESELASMEVFGLMLSHCSIVYRLVHFALPIAEHP
jgi:hypothetical protein